MPDAAPSHSDFLRSLGERALQFDFEPSEPEERPEFIGPYELLEEIARGGMGVVYTARQKGLERIVALKLVVGGRLATAEAEMRFEREARTAARLRHPGIVAIHDFGRAGGHAFFSMDYFPEGDLAQRMTGQTFSPREAARLLEQISLALAHAHGEGVVHRDLKPSNILLDGSHALIADFGLSALIDAGENLTAMTRVLGTPHYLAPEGFAGGSGAMTVASDLYALGAILYEMLTSRPPFGGVGLSQLPALVSTTEPVAPRRINPAVSPDLETICLKCLEKDPSRRYGSAALLAADLGNLLEGRSITARPVSPWVRGWRWSRRHPALASTWILVLALAIVSTVAAILINQGRDQIEVGLTRAIQAEKLATDRLAESQLANAVALEHTGKPGQRFDALASLAEAAKNGVTPALRDAAIVALSETDLRKVRQWTPCSSTESQLAFAPDLKTYLVETAPGLLQSRDILTDQPQATLDASSHGSLLAPPIFSSNGTRVLLRGADQTISVADPGTGQMISEKIGSVAPGWALAELATDLAWTEGATEFCVSAPQGGLDFCQVSDGQISRHWESPLHPFAVAASARAGLLAISDPEAKKVVVIDARTLETRCVLDVPAPICHLAWNPTGSQLCLAGQDGKLRLIDPKNGQITREIEAHRTKIFQAVYSPDGDILASQGGDASLRLWDARTGLSLLVMPGVGSRLNLTFSPDGQRLALSQLDINGLLLDLARPEIVRTIWPEDGERRGALIGALDYSKNGRWLTVASWTGTKIVDAATGQLLANLTWGNLPLDETSAAFAPDNTAIYVCSRARGLGRYPLTVNAVDQTLTVGPLEKLDAEASFILADVSADGQALALTSLDQNAIKIVTPTGTLWHKISEVHAVWSAAFSPDGNWLATQSAGDDTPARPGAAIWSTTSWERVHEFPTGPLGLVTFSPDGNWLAAAGMRQFYLVHSKDWRVAEEPLPEPVARAGAVSSFSAKGDLLAVTVDNGTYLIHPATGKKLGVLFSPQGDLSTARARLNPDGTRLAVMWDDGSVNLWDLAKLRQSLDQLGLAW